MSGGHNIPVPKAGDLRWRITLLRRTVRENSVGESIEVFHEGASIWARVIPWTGIDWYGAEQQHNERTTIFVVRYRAGISPRDRIQYQGAQFNITEIAELGFRQALELLCVEAPH